MAPATSGRGGRSGTRTFLAVAWRAGPGLCVTAGPAVVVSALAPVGVATAVGAVVRHVPGLVGHGLGSAPGRAALGWTAVAGAFMVLQWAGASLNRARTAG